jgi:hypothetical protein
VSAQDLPPVLAACPFCGGPGQLAVFKNGDGSIRNVTARCNAMKPGHCSAIVFEQPDCGGPFTDMASAAAAWNRRSLRAERDAVLEEAAEAVDFLTKRCEEKYKLIASSFLDGAHTYLCRAAQAIRALKAEGVEASPGAEGGGRNELAQPMTASRSPASERSAK